MQLGPRHPWLQQLRLADFVHAVQREDILGEINPTVRMAMTSPSE